MWADPRERHTILGNFRASSRQTFLFFLIVIIIFLVCQLVIRGAVTGARSVQSNGFGANRAHALSPTTKEITLMKSFCRDFRDVSKGNGKNGGGGGEGGGREEEGGGRGAERQQSTRCSLNSVTRAL